MREIIGTTKISRGAITSSNSTSIPQDSHLLLLKNPKEFKIQGMCCAYMYNIIANLRECWIPKGHSSRRQTNATSFFPSSTISLVGLLTRLNFCFGYFLFLYSVISSLLPVLIHYKKRKPKQSQHKFGLCLHLCLADTNTVRPHEVILAPVVVL